MVINRVVINRVKNAVDRVLRKERAGLWQERNTTEQIFILRNILEQACEWRKAFDSVQRSSLWNIMKAYGININIGHKHSEDDV